MGRLLDRAASLDASIYAGIAGAETPWLDDAMRELSRAADHGKLWLGTALALSILDGPRGRLAARDGLRALALASASANLIGKPLTRRVRPVQVDLDRRRHGRMPRSSSFPSGHTASAFAFATAAGAATPPLRPALLGLAVAVGYSRIHTGVHYPADVIAGALIGLGTGSLVRAGRHQTV